MGLKPLPEQYFDEPVKEFTFNKSVPVHVKIPHKQWSGEEIGILRDNLFKSTETLLRLLPNRSKESIYTQRHNIKKMRRSFSEV